MAQYKIFVHQTLIEDVAEFATREEANNYAVKQKLAMQSIKNDREWIWHDIELVEKSC
jgi:hypothetical protein